MFFRSQLFVLENITMEEAKKRRRANRGWLKRQVSRIETELSNPDPDIDIINHELEQLDKRFQSLCEIQQTVEEYLDEDDLDNDIEEADSFLDSYRNVKVKAEKFVQIYKQHNDSLTLTQPITPPNSEIPCNISTTISSLPKLEIKKFGGQFSEWTEFFDRFSAIVDKSSIPVINKFSYLQSLLEGEALSTIKGLSLIEKNYDIAISILKDRYDRKERIIFSHIQRLVNLDIPNSPNDTTLLWTAYNELVSNIRSLETLEITVWGHSNAHNS